MASKFAALALDVDKPTRVNLFHPITKAQLRDAEGKEAYIEVLSSDSEQAQKHFRAIQRRRLNQASRGRNAAKLTPEELENEAIEQLTLCTTGWHLVGLDGVAIDVDYSEENARELYGNRGMRWLRDQIDEAIGDRANFGTASSTS